MNDIVLMKENNKNKTTKTGNIGQHFVKIRNLGFVFSENMRWPVQWAELNQLEKSHMQRFYLPYLQSSVIYEQLQK